MNTRVALNHIAEVDADPEFDPVLCYLILFSDKILSINGAAHRVDGARSGGADGADGRQAGKLITSLAVSFVFSVA